MRSWTFALLCFLFSFFPTACETEIVDNALDFDFETIDKEANQVNLTVTTRYNLTSRLEKKLVRKYGRQYKDSLIIPAISSIARGTLREYSAGEIYNYKRDEIEQKLKGQAKTTFAQYDIELTDFFIRSVKLSDTLMNRLEREHLERRSNEDNKR